MNTGETSDQIVRMTLQGIEVAANVALKAGGEMTRSLAATLYAILTDKKKSERKSKTRFFIEVWKRTESICNSS